MAMVFMIKEKVSSHLLQNLTSCLKDKRIRERDANSETRRTPSLKGRDVPRGPRGEVKLAGGREGNAEGGRS